MFGNSTVQDGCAVIIVWFYCLCSILQVVRVHASILLGEGRWYQRLRISHLAVSWYIILFVKFNIFLSPKPINCIEVHLSPVVSKRACRTSAWSLFSYTLHLKYLFTNRKGFGSHLSPYRSRCEFTWACVKSILLWVNHISRVKWHAHHIGLGIRTLSQGNVRKRIMKITWAIDFIEGRWSLLEHLRCNISLILFVYRVICLPIWKLSLYFESPKFLRIMISVSFTSIQTALIDWCITFFHIQSNWLRHLCLIIDFIVIFFGFIFIFWLLWRSWCWWSNLNTCYFPSCSTF